MRARIEALAPSLLHSVLVNPGTVADRQPQPVSRQGTSASSPGSADRFKAARARCRGVYHIMSPFEATTPIDVMWPLWARDSRIATVVTLYDLIPLVFPDQYLRYPGMRAFYYGSRRTYPSR